MKASIHINLQIPSLKLNGGIKAPFQVLGLQQIWREDGLALYACLIPPDKSPAQNCIKIQKHKVSSRNAMHMCWSYCI